MMATTFILRSNKIYKYEPKGFTATFAPGWTVEDVLNVIIDAVEHERVISDQILENGFQRSIRIQSECGMIIEIMQDLNTREIYIYPEQKWVRTNKDHCDGSCRTRYES